MRLIDAIKKLGPWAVLEYVANPALSLLLTPVLINQLGISGFGQWVLIITAASLPVTFTSGISVALAQHLAFNSTKPVSVLRQVQVVAIRNTLQAAALGGLAIFIWFAVQTGDADKRSQLNWPLFFTVALIVFADCLDVTFAGILRGSLRYAESARAEISARLAQYALMIASVFILPTITMLAVSTLIGSVIRMYARGRLCGLRSLEFKRDRLAPVDDKSSLREMTLWATAQSLGGMLYTSLDRLVISAAFGPTTLGLYAATSQLTNQIQAVSGAMFSVISNATATVSQSKNYANTAHDFARLAIFVGSGAIAAYSLYYFFSYKLFSLWLGATTATDILPMVPAVAIAATIQSIVMPAHFFLLGNGKFKTVAILGIIAGVVSICILWISTQLFDPHIALYARTAYGVVLFSYFFAIYRLIKYRTSPQP